MKLRNLKMNESIEKQYSNALENDKVVLNPTEGNALEVEKARKEVIEDEFKEQDKVADEVAKATNATEVNEPKKVKDRKELSKLLAEAKEAGKQYKISRCNEEGFRYLFETIEPEETKEPLNEDVTITVNPEEIKINDGVEDVAVIPTEGSEEEKSEEKSEEEVESEEVIEPIEECNSKPLVEETNMQKIMRVLGMTEKPLKEENNNSLERLIDFIEEDGALAVKPLSDTKIRVTDIQTEEVSFFEVENGKLVCKDSNDNIINSWDSIEDYIKETTEANNSEKPTEEEDSDFFAPPFDGKRPVGEALNHENEDYFDFTSELYHAIVDVLKEYKHKGVTKADMQTALNFIDVHMDDDEELAFLDSNAEADSAAEEEAEEADWHKDIKDGDIVTPDEDETQEESLNESKESKKSAGTILNDHQC